MDSCLAVGRVAEGAARSQADTFQVVGSAPAVAGDHIQMVDMDCSSTSLPAIFTAVLAVSSVARYATAAWYSMLGKSLLAQRMVRMSGASAVMASKVA